MPFEQLGLKGLSQIECRHFQWGYSCKGKRKKGEKEEKKRRNKPFFRIWRRVPSSIKNLNNKSRSLTVLQKEIRYLGIHESAKKINKWGKNRGKKQRSGNRQWLSLLLFSFISSTPKHSISWKSRAKSMPRQHL